MEMKVPINKIRNMEMEDSYRKTNVKQSPKEHDSRKI